MSLTAPETDTVGGPSSGRGNCATSPPMPTRRLWGSTGCPAGAPLPGSPSPCSSRQTFPARIGAAARPAPASPLGGFREGANRASIPARAVRPPPAASAVAVPPVVCVESPAARAVRPQSVRGLGDLGIPVGQMPSQSPEPSRSRGSVPPAGSLNSSTTTVGENTEVAASPAISHSMSAALLTSPDMKTRGVLGGVRVAPTRDATPLQSQSAILRRSLTRVATADGSTVLMQAAPVRSPGSSLALPSTPASAPRAINVAASVGPAWALPQPLQHAENATSSQARVLSRSPSYKPAPPQSPKPNLWTKTPITTTRRLRSVSPSGTEGAIRITASPGPSGREALIPGPNRYAPGYVFKQTECRPPQQTQPIAGVSASFQSEGSTSVTVASSSALNDSSGRITRQSSSLTNNFQDDFDVDLNSQADSPRTAEPKTRDLSPASQILQQDAPEVALLQQQHEEPLLQMRRLQELTAESSECPESVHLSPAVQTHRSEPECSPSDTRRPAELQDDPKMLVRQQLESIEQALEERMQLREQSQQASINEKLAQQEQMIQQLQKDTADAKSAKSANSGQPQNPLLNGFEDWMERWKHAQQVPQASMEERMTWAVGAEQIQVELAARSRLEALELRAEVERVRAQSAEEIAKLRSEVERLQTAAVDNQISQPLQFIAPAYQLQDVHSVIPEHAAAGTDASGRRIGDVLHGLRDVTQQVDGLVQELGRRTIDAGDSGVEYEQVFRLQSELVEREASMVAATEEISRLRQELDSVRVAGNSRFSQDSFAVMERMRRLRAKIAPLQS